LAEFAAMAHAHVEEWVSPAVLKSSQCPTLKILSFIPAPAVGGQGWRVVVLQRPLDVTAALAHANVPQV
jgi:hypothetical protein